MLKVAVILGSARVGRQSERVWNFVRGELAKRKDVEIVPIDIRDFRFEATALPEDQGEVGKRWQKIADSCDGFVLVMPEYNRGYPGELKMFLDSAYDEYEHKPIAICAVSSGRFGGGRGAEHILPVLHELGFIMTHTIVYFPNMNPAEGDKPETPIPDGSGKRLASVFDELVFLAERLKK